MQYTDEKLNYKLESLEIQKNALEEEKAKIIKEIKFARSTKSSYGVLRKQLRDNAFNLKEVKKQLRQAYKEYRHCK